MKRIFTYLLYVIGFLLLVHYGVKYQGELRIIASKNFNMLTPMLFNSIFSVMIGVYIALPRFINILRTEGKIHVDWLKILMIGLPTFLVSGSGILSYYFGSLELIKLIGWVYIKYNLFGTSLVGIAFGYTLLASITKEKATDTSLIGKYRIAKILTIFLLLVFILYISLSGIIHPLKLVEVHADIVKNDHQSGYSDNDGKTVYFIQTDINYKFEFENFPIRYSNDYKMRIEPKEKLQSLLSEDVFKQPNGRGYSGIGNKTEIYLTYTIGSIDPKGDNNDINPPSQEVLDKINDFLYDAELVIKFNDKNIKRFNLLDYKEK